MIKNLRVLELKQTKLNYFFTIKSGKNNYLPIYNKAIGVWRCTCIAKSIKWVNEDDKHCKHIILCIDIIERLSREIE